MEFTAGAITEAKRRFDDPLILLAGDFNQWRIGDVVADFPDLLEAAVGNTRGDHSIDRIFSNLGPNIDEGTVPPLETDPGPEAASRPSDHRVAYMRVEVPRVRPYVCLLYTSPSPRD